MKFFINFLLKNISTVSLAQILAKIISILLKRASTKGGVYWKVSKKVISQLKIWIDLFEQVYEDDKLTKEEEQLIAEAISNQVTFKSINRIVKNACK